MNEKSPPSYKLHAGFIDALAALTSSEQKLVRESLKKILSGNIGSGLRFHKVGNFNSFSPNKDLRVIVAPNKNGDVFVHVGHHDPAYEWAERHKHVSDESGKSFTVCSGDIFQEDSPAPSSTPISGKFAALPEAVARTLESAADENAFLEAVSVLSPEWQEIALAVAFDDLDPQDSSDVIAVDDEVLEFALSLPEERWRVFIHPKQRFVIDRPNSGHFLLKGGPGTGKTVCLVHRFVQLSRSSTDLKPLFVALNEPADKAVRSMCESLGFFPEEDQIVDFMDLYSRTKDLDDFFRGYSTVLIDEAQDLPVEVVSELLRLLENDVVLPPLFLCFDANQAILQPSGYALDRLSEFCDAQTLRYCYRNTAQILDSAKVLLSNLHQNYEGRHFKAMHNIDAARDFETANVVNALLGDEVSLAVCFHRELVAEAGEMFSELENKYSDLVVMIVGDDEKELKETREHIQERNPETRLFSAQECKGLEFRNGLIIDLLNHSFLTSNPITVNQYKLLSGLYVCLTRFRESVTVLTTVGSPLLP